MKICPSRPQDAPALARLDVEAGIALAWTPTQYAREMLKPTSFCWAAWDDDHLTGSLTLCQILDEGEIANLAVHPLYWRRGIGRALLQTAYQQAAALKLKRLLLEVGATNRPAQALYRSFGFVEDGRRKGYYANGDDAVLMSLKLPG